MLRGPICNSDKTIIMTDRELRVWRKNVAHTILFGRRTLSAEKGRSQRGTNTEESATVRMSRDRKAMLVALSKKKGISVRALVDMLILPVQELKNPKA